jgi:bifunctional DNA-binding transcriptional regulator/antitoxin component of YhaV-PrlF toxin-antitoxin module
MKELDTLTVTKVGQGTLPKWWRDAAGLQHGGVVEVRPVRDGRNSLILTPRTKTKAGAKGLLSAYPMRQAAAAAFVAHPLEHLGVGGVGRGGPHGPRPRVGAERILRETGEALSRRSG